jgi:hypothetical protein
MTATVHDFDDEACSARAVRARAHAPGRPPSARRRAHDDVHGLPIILPKTGAFDNAIIVVLCVFLCCKYFGASTLEGDRVFRIFRPGIVAPLDFRHRATARRT